MTAAEPARIASGRGSAFTVQGWLILVLSVMGILVLVGAAVAEVLLTRTDAVSSQLSDHIQPARVAAYQLQAALRDQETSLRGYVIAADRQFLDPYYAGQRAEQTAAQEIRQHVGDRAGLLSDLTAIEQAAAVWRTSYAEPLIASVVAGKPNVIDNGIAERGKDEFDRLRMLFDIQNRNMTSTRADALNELDTVKTWRDGVLVAILTVILVTAGLLAILVRRAVTRPLAGLAAACRRITDGHFSEVIPSRGPKDLRAMAIDVENMRQRIVDDLEVSHKARTALAEQTAVLDDQAVELRRSNAELEQFAYVASHDLQEPLRKVASFCQLLEKRYADKLDERGIEYIEFAVDGAKRMQVLINDLLTFSRVGRLNTLLTAVDLDTTLSTAIANTAGTIEESGAEIVRTSHLPTVTGDPTLLTQLWQNLISNAVKFRREDRTPRVVIDCDAGADGHDGEYLFSVSDNGIGIAEEFSEKVFVIFQRLHVRDAYSGTGIGLALCKKIVEYHGGAIWIDTSYTDGARFQFTIPAVTTAVTSQGALT